MTKNRKVFRCNWRRGEVPRVGLWTSGLDPALPSQAPSGTVRAFGGGDCVIWGD